MNTQERLNIYKKALKDYKYSLIKETKWYGIFIKYKQTNYGFCHYFLHTHELNVYSFDDTVNRFNSLLPELYSTKPENANAHAHWFKCGKLEPRIECLEKAIKLCENENN